MDGCPRWRPGWPDPRPWRADLVAARLVPLPLAACDAPVRMGYGCCRWVAAGACAGSDGLIGGVHDAAVRLLHAAGASMPSSAVSLAATRAHVRFLSNNRSNLVAVSVILVIDGCWAKALPGVMPVPVPVMSLGFTFLPGGAAADPLSQVPL